MDRRKTVSTLRQQLHGFSLFTLGFNMDLEALAVIVDPPALLLPTQRLDRVLLQACCPDHGPLQFSFVITAPVDYLIGGIGGQIGPASSECIFFRSRLCRFPLLRKINRQPGFARNQELRHLVAEELRQGRPAQIAIANEVVEKSLGRLPCTQEFDHRLFPQ